MRSPRSNIIAGVALTLAVATAGCGSDGLEPDLDRENTVPTPATDSRTVDPPTPSNLGVTVP